MCHTMHNLKDMNTNYLLLLESFTLTSASQLHQQDSSSKVSVSLMSASFLWDNCFSNVWTLIRVLRIPNLNTSSSWAFIERLCGDMEIYGFHVVSSTFWHFFISVSLCWLQNFDKKRPWCFTDYLSKCCQVFLGKHKTQSKDKSFKVNTWYPNTWELPWSEMMSSKRGIRVIWRLTFISYNEASYFRY